MFPFPPPRKNFFACLFVGRQAVLKNRFWVCGEKKLFRLSTLLRKGKRMQVAKKISGNSLFSNENEKKALQI